MKNSLPFVAVLVVGGSLLSGVTFAGPFTQPSSVSLEAGTIVPCDRFAANLAGPDHNNQKQYLSTLCAVPTFGSVEWNGNYGPVVIEYAAAEVASEQG